MQKVQEAIIITGAGRRIGAALAWDVLAQGLPLVGIYHSMTDSVRALQSAGGVMMAGDLSTDAGTMACIADIRDRVSSIRALVHNASIWHNDQVLRDAVVLRNATYHLHVFSPHALNDALVDLFSAQSTGDIIHISDANVPFAKADHALYLASKAGTESLMRSFAQRFAPRIKVNAIAPGLIAFHDTDSPEYRQQRLSRIPMGIEPTAQVMVDAVRYILSCPYMTGHCLTLDGGQAIQG